jgi:hypothetical protein
MRGLLLLAIAVAFVAAPVMMASPAAQARARDHINYGYCKSMRVVFDVRNCKENGGTR